MRYLFLFVGLATLTTVGQRTSKVMIDDPIPGIRPHLYDSCTTANKCVTHCGYGGGGGIESGKPIYCDDLMSKKHKTPVKPAWDMTPPIDDGVAHWQAPKRPTVTCEGCGTGDNLPVTVNKESCTTTYKGKWSDDTNTCYLVEQLGAVGAIMEQIAPEKPDKSDGKLIFSNSSTNMGSGPDGQASNLADQGGYDCTMSRTPKTITINCTLKEPK